MNKILELIVLLITTKRSLMANLSIDCLMLGFCVGVLFVFALFGLITMITVLRTMKRNVIAEDPSDTKGDENS